mgnify:CR=1 FL=1
MKLAEYPEYTATGEKWFRSIPSHWRTLPLYAVAKTKSVSNCVDRELLSVYLDLGVIRFSDIKEKRTNATSEDLSKYQAVDPGDFVLNNQQAWRGSVGVSKYSGIVSPAYLVLDVRNDLDPSYANFLFRDRRMVSQYLVCSKGVGSIQRNLYWPHLKRVTIVIPPTDEQVHIAKVAKGKTIQINKFIRNKRRLIELLKEQKQNVINQAVTRGLDPKVKFKPSGVEWIGDIPERWDVRRLKYLLREVDERSKTGEEQHLSMSQKHGGLVSSSEIEERRLMSDSYAGGKLCKLGDIVLNRLKAHLGVFSHAPCGGVISPDYSVFRAIADIEPVYYEYLLRSTVIRHELRIHCKGIVEGFWRLYSDDFLSLKVPVPQRDEQLEIVKGIEERFLTIDQTIARTEREIELMREYRTRLISDVVTGQVDVRGIEVPEVAEDELLALDEDTSEADDVIDDEGDMDETD